jgi:hypothetical protein
MCALFSTARSDVPHPCQILAERASIEPVLEGCSYLGFIVQLQDFEFEKYLRLHEAISIFVRTVERRIDAREFAFLYIHPASSEIDSTGAPRVVFDPRGRVVYNWQ